MVDCSELFLNNLSVGSVLAHGLNSVDGTGLGLVALALADGLAVAGLQAPAILTALVLIQLILGVRDGLITLNSLVLHVSQSVLLHGLDAVLAACQRREGLAGLQNDLAVGGLQYEGVLLILALLITNFPILISFFLLNFIFSTSVDGLFQLLPLAYSKFITTVIEWILRVTFDPVEIDIVNFVQVQQNFP